MFGHRLTVLLDVLHADALASKVSGNGQVATVTGVGSSHHVCKHRSETQPQKSKSSRLHTLGVEHLLRQLGNADGTVGLRAASGKRCEADHEEVETRERNHVDGKLSQVGVELTRETQACRDAGHDDGNKVVQVAVGGRGQLEGAEADLVKGFVINAEGL